MASELGRDDDTPRRDFEREIYKRSDREDSAPTNAAPQASESVAATPHTPENATRPAVAAKDYSELRGRLDNSAYGSKICREAAAALAELEQAVKQRDTLLGIAEQRAEELERGLEQQKELLRRAIILAERGPVFKPVRCPNCPNSQGFTINDAQESGMARCHSCGHRWQTITPDPEIAAIRKAGL